ncbi:MAG: hypothetical protein NC900_00625 [Candidatus Omnitrophica bacterium]|nr:hypothetical protein [Candidatus Omnitrophota bacterium]
MRDAVRLLDNLPEELKKIINLSEKLASEMDVKIYLVGGFVRDLILGVSNFDLDIAVEKNTLDFASKLALNLDAKLTYHKHFGTANLVTLDKIKVDIATTRREYYLRPAILPTVEPANIEEDLKRRDFTINAIAIRLYPDRELVDFFGGYSDIINRKIRILHPKSFIDDPTRILRAIRFKERFKFKIERATLRELKKAVKLKMLHKVHPHRIRDELILLLKEEKVLNCIKRLNELVGLNFISPELKLSKKNLIFLNSIQRQINWYCKRFPSRRPLDSWLMYFIGLVYPLDIRKLNSICKNFAFRKGDTKRIISYKKEIKLASKLKKKLKPSSIFKYLNPLSYEVILLIKATSSDKLLNKNIDDFLTKYNLVRLCIKGEELKRIGLVCGPQYKKVLEDLLYAKLDKGLSSKEEEISFLKNLTKQ